jgi:hypothetical protein
MKKQTKIDKKTVINGIDVIEFENTVQGGNYYSVGTSGGVTGRGAHLLLIDDPIKGKEDAESVIFKRKLEDFFSTVAYTRLMPGGAIILVMTRWSYDDLAGYLLEEQASENWTVLNLPAIAMKTPGSKQFRFDEAGQVWEAGTEKKSRRTCWTRGRSRSARSPSCGCPT